MGVGDKITDERDSCILLTSTTTDNGHRPGALSNNEGLVGAAGGTTLHIACYILPKKSMIHFSKLTWQNPIIVGPKFMTV